MALENVTLESIAGGLVVLPGLMWIGSVPSWPVSSTKQMEVAMMMDKSKRLAFFDEKREWGIVLGFLTKIQLDIMRTLNGYKENLKFINNNEDATEYTIYISSFSHNPERMDIRQLERYKVEMTLREV
jgi:hypothetical protein